MTTVIPLASLGRKRSFPEVADLVFPPLKKLKEPELIDLTLCDDDNDTINLDVVSDIFSPKLTISPFFLLNSEPDFGRPCKLSDLLKEVDISRQGHFAQLEHLIFNVHQTRRLLRNLKVPVSVEDYFEAEKEKDPDRVAMIPKWIEIDGERFVFNNESQIQFGGYGAVAFFIRRSGSSAINLPELIALKIGDVPLDDLDDLFDSEFDISETKSHWLREFCVQLRLKRSLSHLEQLPFADVYGTSLMKVKTKGLSKRVFVQALTAMEAGLCDLFHLFTTCSLSTNTGNEMLFKVMQSAAQSLEDLHSAGLHHGDVKLANMLVDFKGERAVFMDFDGSVFLDENTTCDTYTEEYVSPQRREEEDYDREADDNWALGISFLIAITLKKSPIEKMPLSVIKGFDMKFHLKLFLMEMNMPQKKKRVLLDVVLGLLQPEEYDRMTAGEASRRLKQLML